MPQAVRDRYESMEESPRRTAMLQNFDQAVSHPDQQDLENLKTALTNNRFYCTKTIPVLWGWFLCISDDFPL